MLLKPIGFNRFITGGGGGGVTDDFNRADSTLESDAAWDFVSGQSGAMDVVSNQLRLLTGAANLSVYTHTDTPAGANQFAEMDFVSATNVSTENRMYIGCRNDASGNGYYLRIDTAANQARIVEYSAGSENVISFLGSAPTAGQTVRFECNGTTIRFLYDGVEQDSITNAVHSAAGIWALRSYQDAATDAQVWDNYNHGVL